jgi:hypothetical protein
MNFTTEIARSLLQKDAKTPKTPGEARRKSGTFAGMYGAGDPTGSTIVRERTGITIVSLFDLGPPKILLIPWSHDCKVSFVCPLGDSQVRPGQCDPFWGTYTLKENPDRLYRLHRRRPHFFLPLLHLSSVLRLIDDGADIAKRPDTCGVDLGSLGRILREFTSTA